MNADQEQEYQAYRKSKRTAKIAAREWFFREFDALPTDIRTFLGQMTLTFPHPALIAIDCQAYGSEYVLAKLVKLEAKNRHRHRMLTARATDTCDECLGPLGDAPVHQGYCSHTCHRRACRRRKAEGGT